MKPLSSFRTQTLRCSWIRARDQGARLQRIQQYPLFRTITTENPFPSPPRPHSSPSTRNQLVLLVCPTSAVNGLRLAISPSGPSSMLILTNPDPSDIEALDRNPRRPGEITTGDGNVSDCVFSKPEFTAILSYLSSGTVFALIPSRDEPFGLVAVVFGCEGALGASSRRVGGFGLMPDWARNALGRPQL